MLTGKLWLDYAVDGDEEHYDANVTRAILRDDAIVLEFSGFDPDEGHFSGSCSLKKQNAFYVGGGSFTVGKLITSANVSATLEQENGVIAIQGTWQDFGDGEAYDLTVELEAKAGS